MREHDLIALEHDLLAAGIAPEYIHRTIDELREHRRDLEAAALAAGLTPEQAAEEASRLLGTRETLAGAVAARPELKAWSHRWPLTAQCVESAVTIAVLPAVPVVYCAQRGSAILRWLSAATLALLGTAAWLLLMQSAIPYV